MRTQFRCAVVTATVALVIVGAVGRASANHLSFSSRFFRIVWVPMTLRGTENFGELIEVSCSVTFEGSLHNISIAKVAGNLIGYITRAIAGGPCAKGRLYMLNGSEVLPGGARATNTLPWHLRYRAYEGTLPFITEVHVEINNAKILLAYAEELRDTCLYRSEETTFPLEGFINRNETGRLISLTLNESFIKESAGELTCPGMIAVAEVPGSLTVLNTQTSIVLTLI